jgi:microcystin-dependent protein
MSFQSITNQEIETGAPVDTGLLSKVKNNDDSLKATNDLQDTTINNLVVVPVGAMLPFAGSVAPANFALTIGQEVSRAQYPILFSTIGTTYGAGNGTTTFNLPDTRAAFLRGAGTSVKFSYNKTTNAGQYESDAIQGHWHSIAGGTTVPRAHNISTSDHGYVNSFGTNSSIDPVQTSTYVPDSQGNGTPRVATETRPMNVGVNYIIRIQ